MISRCENMIKLVILVGLQLLSKVDCYLYNRIDQSNAKLTSKRCNLMNETHYYWRIKNYPKDAFLFGSLHIPFIKLFRRLPAFLDERLDKTDIVYFELDLLNPEIRRQLLACQLDPQQEQSKHYLADKQIYRKLKAFFRAKRNQVNDKLYFDMLIRNWRLKKLVWILLLINFIENDSEYLRVPSMDILIALKARQRSKIKSLESVYDQCSALDSLDQNQVVSYINLTMNNYFMNLTRKQQVNHLNIDTLIQDYNCGTLNNSLFSEIDLNSGSAGDAKHNKSETEDYNVNRSSVERNNNRDEMQSMNRKFQRQLIEKRNKKIGEMISSELDKNRDKNLLFVVGTAHFISTGTDSVLKNLEDKGYQIERVNKIIHPVTDPASSKNYFSSELSSVYQRQRTASNGLSRSFLHASLLNQTANKRLDAVRKSYNDFWIFFKIN